MEKTKGCFNCKHSRFTKAPKYDWLVAKCLVRHDESGGPFITDNFFDGSCKEWEKA